MGKIVQKASKPVGLVVILLLLVGCRSSVIGPKQVLMIHHDSTLTQMNQRWYAEPIWQVALYAGHTRYLVQAYAYRIGWDASIVSDCGKMGCYATPIHAPATVPYLMIYRQTGKEYVIYASGLVDTLTSSRKRTIRTLMRKMGYGRVKQARHVLS